MTNPTHVRVSSIARHNNVAHVNKYGDRQMGIVDTVAGRLGFVTKEAAQLMQVREPMTFAAFDSQESGNSWSALCDNYRSWVYTSIDKIAKAVATIPLKFYVYKKSGKVFNAKGIKAHLNYMDTKDEREYYMKANNIEREEITEHPLIDLLNCPNLMSTRFTLWYDTMIRLELKGECGWYLAPGLGGQPSEIFALPLRKQASLTAIPDPKTMLKGFLYKDGNLKQIFTPEEIIFYRYPSPASPYTGMSPLLAQMYPYDIELYLMQQQRAMFKNKIAPGAIFTTDQKLVKKQVDDMAAHVKQQFRGASKTGNPMFVHSGMKYDSKSGSTNKQMDISGIAEFTRDKIITSYDLSPGHVGLVKDVNRANMEVLQDSFVRECLKPKTMLIEEYLEKQLLPLYDDNLTADFELPDLEEKEFVLKERESNIKTGFHTINEERAEMGEEPVPWGDAPWFPINYVQPTDKAAAPAKSALPVQVNTKAYSKEYWTDERKELTWKAFVAQSEAHEQLFIPVMNKTFDDQLAGILERLPVKHRRISGQIAAILASKTIDPSAWLKANATFQTIMFDQEEETLKLAEEFQPLYVQVVGDVGTARYDSLMDTQKNYKQNELVVVEGVAYNVNDPSATQYIGQKLATSPASITDTTFFEIEEILKDGFAAGLPVTEVASQITAKFSSFKEYRSLAIARTETISASNFADLDAVEQTGLGDTLLKFWIDSKDSQVRDSHVAAAAAYGPDGAIGTKDAFVVGADSMPAPANGTVAAENINCRCTIGYVEK